MQALIMFEDGLFLREVIKYGIANGSLPSDAVEKMFNVEVPQLMEEIFQVKKIKFTDPQQSADALKDIVQICSFGMQCRVGTDLDQGVKLLLHEKGGIRYCFKKGNTELLDMVNLCKKIIADSSVLVAGLSPLPGHNQKGGQRLDLLSPLEHSAVEIYTKPLRPTWPMSIKYAKAYDLKAHQERKDEIRNIHSQVLLLKTFTLARLLGPDDVRSIQVFSHADIFTLFSGGLMIHLALSDFKRTHFILTIDMLDAFREKFCDFRDGVYYLRYEIVPRWIEWLSNYCLQREELANSLEFLIQRWNDIIECIASSLSQPKYTLSEYTSPGNINNVFAFRGDLNLEDPRIDVSSFVVNSLKTDIQMRDFMDGLDGSLLAEFLSLPDPERIKQLETLSAISIGRMFMSLLEDNSEYRLVAYYLMRMKERKAADVLLHMEQFSVAGLSHQSIPQNERVAIKSAKEIYQKWTWRVEPRELFFNDFNVNSVFHRLNVDLQEFIMQTLKDRAANQL